MHKCVHADKYGNVQCWKMLSVQRCTLFIRSGRHLGYATEREGPARFQPVGGGHVSGTNGDIISTSREISTHTYCIRQSRNGIIFQGDVTVKRCDQISSKCTTNWHSLAFNLRLTWPSAEDCRFYSVIKCSHKTWHLLFTCTWRLSCPLFGELNWFQGWFND